MSTAGLMTHIQTDLSDEEYERFRSLATERGLSIREALREATVLWIDEQDRVDAEDPLFTSVESVRSGSDGETETRAIDEADVVEEWSGDAAAVRVADSTGDDASATTDSEHTSE